jgi:hypothetical protein
MWFITPDPVDAVERLTDVQEGGKSSRRVDVSISVVIVTSQEGMAGKIVKEIPAT